MAITSRGIHRDLGYFYLGLIISFSISGILLNHRQTWHPERYTVETKEVAVQLPSTEAEITEDVAKNAGKTLGINDKFRRFSVKKGELRINYEKHDLELDIASGKGQVITYNKTPLVAQSIQLHKDTSNWWIYYSDVFGFAMLTIAITGAIMYPKGPFSFKQRGWKLTLLGIIFPLIFLFFLS